jgi:futalosine hydrolase
MKQKCEFCLMQILLTAATENELELFINMRSNVDILITGVGTPATIYQLQKRLHQQEYDFVIQAGIAGAFSHELNLGETVLIKQDTFGDLGAEENQVFTSFIGSGFINANGFPYADGWLINAEGIPKNTALKSVKGITLNKVSDSQLQKQQMVTTFNPQIESMEGAAFHYVCLQEEIPFLQIRTVSNYVGERDKTKWKIREAFENLNEELVTLINGLTN